MRSKHSRTRFIEAIDWSRINDEEDEEDVKKGIEPSAAYKKKKDDERRQGEVKKAAQNMSNAFDDMWGKGSFDKPTAPHKPNNFDEKEYTEKQIAARVAKRDSDWESGKQEREEKKKTQEDSKIKDIKLKTINAIENYGNEYRSSKQMPLFDTISQIFVPGVRLKADAAIKQVSSELLDKIKGKDWDTAFKIIKDDFGVNESTNVVGKSLTERWQRLAGILK